MAKEVFDNAVLLEGATADASTITSDEARLLEDLQESEEEAEL